MINREFVFKNEGSHSYGYVPVKERRITSTFRGTEGTVLGASGVTIGMGLDLGQRSDLSDLKLPSDIADKLKPYLTLKKEVAQAKLKVQPLELTEEQCKIINNRLVDSYVVRAQTCWDKAFNIKYQELNENQRTCIFDLIYQHGNIFSPKHSSYAVFSPFNDFCKEKKWDKASEFLSKLDNGYLNRNKKRAELLK